MPGHPATAQAPEKALDRIVGEFFDTYVFGPDRAALVAAQLPATQADADADRDAARAALDQPHPAAMTRTQSSVTFVRRGGSSRRHPKPSDVTRK